MDYIEDHVQRSIDLLVSQFKYSDGLHKLVSVLTKQLQDLEDVNKQFYEERNIFTAIGAQLDGIGDIVGETRKGRDDEEYRAALLFRMYVNVSCGTPENLITILGKITVATKVRIWENFPACAQLFTDGTVIPKRLLETMQDVAPAAISDIPITISLGNTPYFIFGNDPHIEPLYVRTRDEVKGDILLELDDDSVLSFQKQEELSLGQITEYGEESIDPLFVHHPRMQNGKPIQNYQALVFGDGGFFRFKDGKDLYVGPATGFEDEDNPLYVFTGDADEFEEGEGLSEIGFFQLAFADGSVFSHSDGYLMNVLEREGQMIEYEEKDKTQVRLFHTHESMPLLLHDGSVLSVFTEFNQYDVQYAGKFCDVLQKEGFKPTPSELAIYKKD